MVDLLSRGSFRPWVLRCYRAISIAAPVIAGAFYGWDMFGEGEMPFPFVMIGFAFAFAMIPAFFVSLVGGVVLRHDWKTALPLWLYVAAALLAIDSQWIGAQKPALFEFAGWMIIASLVAAAWSGWTQRNITAPK